MVVYVPTGEVVSCHGSSAEARIAVREYEPADGAQYEIAIDGTPRR